jgi:hypothetical protein
MAASPVTPAADFQDNPSSAIVRLRREPAALVIQQ